MYSSFCRSLYLLYTLKSWNPGCQKRGNPASPVMEARRNCSLHALRFSPQISCHPLLEYFKNYRWCGFWRLTDEQMDVRHHYITNQRELIPVSNGSQGFHKQVARPNRAQQRNPTITAERNKM